MAQNILIIGATSAIALACARRWAAQDVCFFLVGRTPDKLAQVAADLGARGARVHSHVLDLHHTEQHAAMLDACYAALPRVDLALLAHGTLPVQAQVEADAALALRAFSDNAVSVIALLTDLANRMQAQRSGCIAVIASVAGDRGRPSNYVYGAAKAAVATFCSGLQARLHPYGVQVLTIKPGMVDTPMTQGLALPRALLASPERVAADIQRALRQGQGTLYTPWFWRPVMLAIGLIPGALFKRLRL